MQEHRFPFEKLEAWQESRKLIKAVYSLTETFPSEEKFGLPSQINRAAVPVASNLAEGGSRTSLKDQGHFSQLAFSSLMELACQVTIATDLGLTPVDCATGLRKDINKLANMINSFRKSQIARAKK